MVSSPLIAATLHLALSLAAKMFMSLGVRSRTPAGGYEDSEKERVENISRAQLNVAEYEATFIVLFLFLHVQKCDGGFVAALGAVTLLAQAVYFWGRALSGRAAPWAAIGAVSRYCAMVLFVLVLGLSSMMVMKVEMSTNMVS